MILGMLPMALGLGEGGEQNAPLGRAVIGGLLGATVTTLFVVPIIYLRTNLRRSGAGSRGTRRLTRRDGASERLQRTLRMGRSASVARRAIAAVQGRATPRRQSSGASSFACVVCPRRRLFRRLSADAATRIGASQPKRTRSRSSLPRVPRDAGVASGSHRPASSTLPGTMQAVTEAPILARADGYLKRRLADIGDRVHAGPAAGGDRRA